MDSGSGRKEEENGREEATGTTLRQQLNVLLPALQRSISDTSSTDSREGDRGNAPELAGFNAFKENHLKLLRMGFTHEDSEAALFRTNNIGVDAALEWLIENRKAVANHSPV